MCVCVVQVREALEESHDEASLEALQSLLSEADTIPVVMVGNKTLTHTVTPKDRLAVAHRPNNASVCASWLCVCPAD